MQLQNRKLSMQDHGEDVRRLQEKLPQLGHAIPEQEAAQNLFGQGTHQAVQAFQRQHNLQPTGVVDEETARLINEAVEAQQEQFVVEGTIYLRDQTPVANAVVCAFDKDLRREEPLGECVTTSEQGFYRIAYTADQFSRAEKKRADLFIRAYTQQDVPLGESDVIFNAGQREQINLVVEAPEEIEPSEYEKLLATLAPVLQDLPPAELTEDDISFLLKELADESIVSERRLTLLAQGARLAQETGLPTEFFYGVARVLELETPLTLDAFLTLKVDTLRQAAIRAVVDKIIPAELKDNLEDILASLELLKIDQGLLVQRELAGRLVNKETGEPLAGFRVLAEHRQVDPESRQSSYDTTDAQGRFALIYTAPVEMPTDGDQLEFTIFDTGNEELHQEVEVVEEFGCSTSPVV